jgi:hypothetical protein
MFAEIALKSRDCSPPKCHGQDARSLSSASESRILISLYGTIWSLPARVFRKGDGPWVTLGGIVPRDGQIYCREHPHETGMKDAGHWQPRSVNRKFDARRRPRFIFEGDISVHARMGGTAKGSTVDS